jgi:hypothetical protein
MSRVEPSSDMRQAAHQLREMYVALKAEGFSDKQALTIVGQAIGAGISAAANNQDQPDTDQ